MQLMIAHTFRSFWLFAHDFGFGSQVFARAVDPHVLHHHLDQVHKLSVDDLQIISVLAHGYHHVMCRMCVKYLATRPLTLCLGSGSESGQGFHC